MACDSVIRGPSLEDVSMRNILKLRGPAEGAMAGLQKACSGGMVRFLAKTPRAITTAWTTDMNVEIRCHTGRLIILVVIIGN
jgi:hypothetical protein